MLPHSLLVRVCLPPLDLSPLDTATFLLSSDPSARCPASGIWGGPNDVAPNDTPIQAQFVTAMVKGGADSFALAGGDAQAGELTRIYDGPRPHGYQPMKKQGSIILGIGGDNSNRAVGTFYEGVSRQPPAAPISPELRLLLLASASLAAS